MILVTSPFCQKTESSGNTYYQRHLGGGGFYERMIQTTKRVLKKILGRARLTLEELQTTLAEIEAVLNSRPLTYSSAEDISTVITPSHLVNWKRLISLPHEATFKVTGAENSRSEIMQRQDYVNRLLQHFHNRWRKEYLTELRMKHHHQSSYKCRGDVEKGDVVIVENEKMPRHLWKLGRIEELITSKDGKIRGATVKTEQSSIQRPIQKLYPLEVEDQHGSSDAVPTSKGTEDQHGLSDAVPTSKGAEDQHGPSDAVPTSKGAEDQHGLSDAVPTSKGTEDQHGLSDAVPTSKGAEDQHGSSDAVPTSKGAEDQNGSSDAVPTSKGTEDQNGSSDAVPTSKGTEDQHGSSDAVPTSKGTEDQHGLSDAVPASKDAEDQHGPSDKGTEDQHRSSVVVPTSKGADDVSTRKRARCDTGSSVAVRTNESKEKMTKKLEPRIGKTCITKSRFQQVKKYPLRSHVNCKQVNGGIVEENEPNGG